MAMALARTEAVNEQAAGLDTLPPQEVLSRLAAAQAQAAASVAEARREIAGAAEAVASRLAAGGRLIYAAAGSSGLMALADALELPGTYGIARDRVVVLIAGGRQALEDLAGAPEDDAAGAATALAALDPGPLDALICVSASGTTPYALGALEEGRARGAFTVGIANNAGAPLVTRADVGIVLATPPELIAGSTRMGAGTAQKIALNMLSTLAAIHLGHVHDGYMINLRADNAKLRDRPARIVAAIAGCGDAEARAALDITGGAVKPAVLLACGATDAAAAETILAEAGHRLRPALARLHGGSGRSPQHGT
jgi:N-acetylmuramic acid 6-phosphate etherase